MADKEEDKLSVDDLDFEALDFSMEEEDDEILDDELDEQIEDEDDTPAGDEGEEDLDEGEGEDPDTDEEDDEDDEGKEGEEDEKSEDDEPRIVDNIVKTLGYELSEEELEGIEDTEEGLTNLTKLISEKAAQEEFDNMVEASPNVKALYDFEKQGGDPQEFMQAYYPSTDFSEVEVDEDDVDTQKEIIRLSLEAKGLNEDRVKRNLQAIEDSGNLLDESKDSLEDLRTMQEQERSRIKEETERRQKQAKEQAEEDWQKVDNIVSKGQINELPIPDAKQKEFKSFITPDPKTGQSPRDKKAANMTMEDHLAVDLILFYGFDGLNKLIDKKSSSKASRSLKDKLKSNKDRGKNTSQDPDLDKPTDGNIEDLEFRIGE